MADMMKKVWWLSGIMMLALSLNGCAAFSTLFNKQHVIKSRDYEYLKSQQGVPLQVPVGVDGSQLGNDYPLPGGYGVPRVAVSEVPPGSAAAR